MNKYVSPTIKIEEIEAADLITASRTETVGYEVKSLEGVDTGDEKTAVFDASKWF